MKTIQIVTSKGKTLEIPLASPAAIDHFQNPTSFTGVILDQINNRRLYDRYFAGKDGLVLLDLGANVGLVSLYAQDACARVIAVEPCPVHCAILRELTAPFPNIEIVPVAIAPVTQPISLFLKRDNTTMHSLVGSGADTVTVDGITLTRLCDQYRLDSVDLCKVDIEGSEFLALTPDEVKSNNKRIKSYFMECHPAGDHVRTHFEQLFGTAGYQVETLGIDTLYAHL